MGKKKIIQKSHEELLDEAGGSVAVSAQKTDKTVKRGIERGNIYIQASYNNTMITVTDEKGNVLTWLSAGSLGFSGPKKATPFAASKVAEAIAEKLQRSGPLHVHVLVRGVGKGRDAAVRSLASKGLNVLSLKDVTPIPHNGPRPRKVRRV